MALIIENISGSLLDINDLGVTLDVGGTMDLSTEQDPTTVARSAITGGDLEAVITAGSVVVKDPNDDVTNLSTSEGIIATRLHNQPPYQLMHLSGNIAEIATGNKTFTGLTKIGGSLASLYQLSVQSNVNSSWIEILNNGGSNQGAFFGINSNNFELWNYQGGSIDFYTAPTASNGFSRFEITNAGDYLFKSFGSGGGRVASIGTNGKLELGADIGDLDDVNNVIPLDRQVLIYDGVTDNRYENRALTEADISDLQPYLLDVSSSRLEDLINVDSSPNGGDILRYATIGGGQWFAVPEKDDLADLDDTIIASPADGEILVYDSGNWQNVPQIDEIGELTDVTITTPANNQVLTYSGGQWINQAPAGGGGSPGGSDSHVQYNNGGVFGGEANYTYDDTNKRIELSGPAVTTRSIIHSGTDSIDVSQIDKAATYIQVDGDVSYEGVRTHFKRSTAGISGWITYNYDGSTPNIRIIDEDDDPAYVAFQVIGNGTFDTPQFDNRFGGRGPVAGATTGFKWTVNGTDVMDVDSTHLQLPAETTANRPGTPADGMIRYNTTDSKFEGYEAGSWKQLNTMRPTFAIFAEENSSVSVGTNNYEYSFGNGGVNTTADPPGIPMGVNCTLIGIGVSGRNTIAGTSTVSISIVKNGTTVATGNIASASGQTAKVQDHTDVTPDTVTFVPGDTVQFLTASTSGTLDEVRVVAWFERTS